MRFIAKTGLLVEPVLLGIVVGAFWFDNPTRVNFLLLLIPPLLARLFLYRRLWVNTPLNLPLYLFLLLGAANTFVAMQAPGAPYSWGWYMIGRPVMGIAFALSLTSIAYERGRIDGVLLAALGLALLVGVLGLTSAQYIDKSAELQFVIEHLPQLHDFPGAEGGFNVNEIGGAMAFFAPLAAGIAIYDLRQAGKNRIRLVVAILAFVVLALALFLGQSRFALLGVVIALGLVVLLLIRERRWRWVAVGLLLAFCALEIGIVLDVFGASASSPALNERDENSLSQRPVIWGAALGIIRDYPLTGVGLNEFRSREVRARYPVPNFSMSIVPHAHNELLQIGTDAGIPGMILYIVWHVALVVMVWRVWRKGEPLIKAVAISAAAGLLAHAFFGLADAITLFDRFTWAYWLLVGLVGGAYALTYRREGSPVAIAQKTPPAA